MSQGKIKAGMTVSGSLLPEPIEVLALVPMGTSLKVIGRGTKTGMTHTPIFSEEQLNQLILSAEQEPFDGDAALFRLGVEAHRLGLAYEYDPYFSLSIARVDPLPHQLEAVYDYFIRLPRIRFLLADDPGAGKTIMAGLLLKELKARGLVQRTLIVTPANLTFQWQRELKDKFRENFEIVRGDVLRANYGQNPWQEKSQVVTSISWVSTREDAKASLLRSHWDLIIVDEAHKMSAYANDRKTLAYQLGEKLAEMTDHYLLMTATPHKGDPENFCRFLALLDRDVYGNIQSLQKAMREHEAPFYLRRTKEALVGFPDPETGAVHRLFTKRVVHTAEFELDGEELEFYDQLTAYVEDQSMRAAQDDSPRGRAVGFTMAMLQRRMASTLYAARRTLERMKERREKILADPDAYRQEQITKRLPDDFEDLTEEEQQEIVAALEDVVASVDPTILREEIARLTQLIDQARPLEKREIESKLTKLKQVLNEQGFFADPSKKLLIFTEHKDSLDYLAGDGKENRPYGKLLEWGLTVTQIHGGMKIGDRDTPGSRIYAEREFREQAQILVATEAAGEGINLQFCSRMINYDIPWNPIRLEQRVGRIHRYGQEYDCLIFNFVAKNTREGRVLQMLLERLKEIRRELGTDQVFDVVGEVFPANLLDKLFRDLYARRTNESAVTDRIVRDVDPKRFRAITESALEGLAKKDLNLSAIVGRSVEARERRLVPEAIEQFFVQAGPVVGMRSKPTAAESHIYRIGKVPRFLVQRGDALEPRFGRLGREYKLISFDKALLKRDPTLEWVTPGHPLFEVVREASLEQVEGHLKRGAVFFDIQRREPGFLDLFAASIKDGRGNTLHRRLFVMETEQSGSMAIRQPTVFLDINPAPAETSVLEPETVPARSLAEGYLYEHALKPWLEDNATERAREIVRVAQHVEISLHALIDRQNEQLADYLNRQIEGQTGLEGIIAQAEQHLDDLNNRLETRRKELEMERHCTVADIVHLGRARVIPHPERQSPQIAPMVRDDEVERIAVDTVRAYEEARGCVVESVEADNRGFDLISRKPHPEDPKSFIEVRFIEVKGRAGVGEIFLSANEYRAAERLKGDYWLYAVFNCVSKPELHPYQNPAQLDWQPVTKVEHYKIKPDSVLGGSMMDIETLKIQLALGESVEREFKSDRRQISDKEIYEEVTAMANASGGVLFIGVEDNGMVSGAKPRHGKMTDAVKMQAAIFNNTVPSINTRISLIAHPDGQVIAISVDPYPEPCATTTGKSLRRTLGGDGKPQTVAYYPRDHRSRRVDLGLLDFSAQPIQGTGLSDLDPLEFERLRQTITRLRGDRSLLDLSDEDLAKALRLVETQEIGLVPNVAGLLLLGREKVLRDVLPTHEAHFQVLDSQQQVRVNDTFHGPLLQTLEHIEARFTARNNEQEVAVGLFRLPVPDYSLMGFREAVNNAVLHRDFSQMQAVYVQWQPDHLLITNPGSLPSGVTLENLLVHEPKPRNPRLAEAFKRIGLVEQTGRGVDKIFLGQLQYGRPAPDYSRSDAYGVRVILRGGEASLQFAAFVFEQDKQGHPLTLDDLLVLNTLFFERQIDSETAARLLQKESANARATLERLHERGLIERRGNKRATSYHLSAALYQRFDMKAEYIRAKGFGPIQHEQMVLEYARQHGEISRKKAAELCQLNVHQASRVLQRVSSKNKELQLVGNGRGARYVWKHHK